ncbi:F-box protein [Aspergillus clavatus NRRL 1]|uniref:F-box domain protein n=1 Tax=Aspergillus clavatus (strain ATCC 1007 / CBS 513.65 / DSM 816 / NCTC 3887 / NRRL 1 / QM 1276 / 107) TaxID=344612 RepID=A1CRD3_ASPCL|nr:F-box domain protein [Aspergillus clavatus NRRL 1]EAW08204.1 F-box domain protein [Aspergillus clavatus NRRL 1]
MADSTITRQCHQRGRVMGLPSMPLEIFWMVLKYLDPVDIVRSRRVSRCWKEAFTNPEYLVRLMTELFPQAQEVRELESSKPLKGLVSNVLDDQHWRKLFDKVASRYNYLHRGKPKSVQKLKLCEDFGISGEREWFQVQPWDNHASHLMQRVDRVYPETFWTYEDGLLVYPSADYASLVLLDVEADKKTMVPFLIIGKVIRRIRLQRRVLVVEWAEPKAFHWLNDSDGVHRHFASSFDVVKGPDGWNVTFRNEWKIMFLGHPLSERDRFYSTHSKTHYVIYIWQPNRSLYTADEDAPIESLFVWDISKPSPYRPSLDPAGRQRDDELGQSPSIVSRFGFRELGFFSVRQRGIPGIHGLEITEDDQSIEIIENLCTGPLDRLVGPAEWTSQVQITSIPLIGDGPCWRRDVDYVLPPYRGSSGLQTEPLSLLCDKFWYTAISEAYDTAPQVGFALHLSPFGWPFDYKTYLSVQTPSSRVVLKPDDANELAGKGKICGNEKFVLGENGNRELVIWRFD